MLPMTTLVAPRTTATRTQSSMGTESLSTIATSRSIRLRRSGRKTSISSRSISSAKPLQEITVSRNCSKAIRSERSTCRVLILSTQTKTILRTMTTQFSSKPRTFSMPSSFSVRFFPPSIDSRASAHCPSLRPCWLQPDSQAWLD